MLNKMIGIHQTRNKPVISLEERTAITETEKRHIVKKISMIIE